MALTTLLENRAGQTFRIRAVRALRSQLGRARLTTRTTVGL